LNVISFDRVADVYDRTRGLPDEVMSRLVETLTAELDGHKEILDLGVGTGRLAVPLQKTRSEVVGIDISRKMISKAKEKHTENLLLADACSFPFRDHAFDVTISVHLLHLINEWQKTLKEVCRVTRHSMLSLYYAHKDPVRQKYYQLLRQHGHESRRSGMSEQELKSLIKPEKLLFVASYDTFADEQIVNLEHGTSSSQWEIPSQVNKQVVSELKMEFAGKTFCQDLYLLVWTTASLNAHIETMREAR
jgi:ubiquinone/menaquinone biosynthesis C-methylase UbiE